jgi:hypothetical protein
MLRTATVSGAVASSPTLPGHADVLGAMPGHLVTRNTLLVSVLRDSLGIFSGTAGVFPGFAEFEPIASVASPAQVVSAAGTGDSSEAIVGYRLGSGFVVDVGLIGFGANLSLNVNAEEFVSRLWTVLGG